MRFGIVFCCLLAGVTCGACTRKATEGGDPGGPATRGGPAGQTTRAAAPQTRPAGKGPAAMVNEQIEQFNSTRTRDAGVFPITQRADRVVYDASTDSIRCLDRQGAAFLTLVRQEDRHFKGTLQVEYHQLTDPGKPRSWGHVTAEFHLPGSVVDVLRQETP